MLTIASVIHMDFELQLMIKLHNEAHADYDEITKWVFKFNVNRYVIFARVQMHRSIAACGHVSPSFMCVLEVECKSSG